MELLSVRTARFIGVISTAELNPRGLLVYPALVDGLIEKYGFVVAPEEDAVFDEEKGVTFEDGGWGNIGIDRVTIFTDAVVVETRSSTNDSEAIFEEALNWGAASYGLTYKPEMVSRRIYVSEVTFTTARSLNSINPKFDAFTRELSSSLKTHTGLDVQHEVTSVGFQYDHSQLKFGPAAFRVERMENSAFSSNKYYSAAPLPTEEHLRLIGEFEQILTSE